MKGQTGILMKQAVLSRSIRIELTLLEEVDHTPQVVDHQNPMGVAVAVDQIPDVGLTPVGNSGKKLIPFLSISPRQVSKG